MYDNSTVIWRGFSESLALAVYHGRLTVHGKKKDKIQELLYSTLSVHSLRYTSMIQYKPIEHPCCQIIYYSVFVDILLIYFLIFFHACIMCFSPESESWVCNLCLHWLKSWVPGCEGIWNCRILFQWQYLKVSRYISYGWDLAQQNRYNDSCSYLYLVIIITVSEPIGWWCNIQ